VGGNQWTAAPVNPSAAPSIGATGDTVLSSSLADATVRRNASVPQMDSPTTGAGSPLPSERVPPDVRSAASPTITAEPSNAAFVRYTVMPGDTLTKIASVYYGTKSNSVVSAIADANRAVVPTRNSLRAGVELTLPVVEVTGTAAVDAAQVRDDPPQTRIATAGSDIGDGWARWYQVKKGDRYAGIARDELGDAGRWKEIYELNKEKFPDPGQIREGVRIKLPATTGAGGQGQRKPSKEKRG
jgi:nucleoid-associated protein YgaU